MEVKLTEELFRRHYGALCLYATHFVGDIDEAEDVVMDCFVKFSEKSDVLQEKSYLYRMVHNECIEHNRKALRHKNAMVCYDEDIMDDLQEAIERSERELRLWRAIDSLPEACRNVLLLSKRDGMKNREIAEDLGISIKTVEAQISKAYRRLRETAKTIYYFFF